LHSGLRVTDAAVIIKIFMIEKMKNALVTLLAYENHGGK
jgi:hypothetical protein